MKNNIFICLSVCFVTLCAMSCVPKGNSSTPSLTSSPPKRPNMDTRKSTTPTKKTTSKSALGGVVIDGCRENASVNRGETLQILLPAIAGTGYIWIVAKPSGILTQSKKDDIEYIDEAKTDPTMVGTPQKQVLSFNTTNAGTEIINLLYIRPFEKDKIEKSCSIRITVQ